LFDFQHAASALGEVIGTLAFMAAIVAMLEVILYVLLVRWLHAKLALPIMLVAPAALGLIVFYVYPLLWELNVSFTKMSIRNFVIPGFLGLGEGKNNLFVGLQNYVNVFTGPVLKQTGFWQLLLQTSIWTVINVSLHVTGGIGLALLLNRRIRGRNIYRAMLILPWAIPALISLQIWRTEYNQQFGAVNQILRLFGISAIPWLSDAFWNFVAMIITNVWLGIPFMMVITLGGLQSISRDYYEAAEIDGANGRDTFWKITLPLLRPVLIPAILLGTFLTFNNIAVPFFINQNELETSDILVTGLYRAAFQYSRYGFAAAFAFTIFAVLLIFTTLYIRKTNALKGAYE
jgi:arabinogalactan oligomer/maltooligosaccharide transport system permease protein